MLAKKIVPKVIKLDLSIKSRLDRLSKVKDRSAHWLMQEAIARYLDQEEYHLQLNQETVARWQEAEQGKVVSHKSVSEWLTTWGTETETDRPVCGT